MTPGASGAASGGSTLDAVARVRSRRDVARERSPDGGDERHDEPALGADGRPHAPACPVCGQRLDGLLTLESDAWPIELRCPECGRRFATRRAIAASPLVPRWSVEHPRGPVALLLRTVATTTLLVRPRFVHRRLDETGPIRGGGLLLALLGMIAVAVIVATLANLAVLRATGGPLAAHAQAVLLPWSSVPVVDHGPMPPTARSYLEPYWSVAVARLQPIVVMHAVAALVLVLLPSARRPASPVSPTAGVAAAAAVGPAATAAGGSRSAGAHSQGTAGMHAAATSRGRRRARAELLVVGRGAVLGLGMLLAAWSVWAVWIATFRHGHFVSQHVAVGARRAGGVAADRGRGVVVVVVDLHARGGPRSPPRAAARPRRHAHRGARRDRRVPLGTGTGRALTPARPPLRHLIGFACSRPLSSGRRRRSPSLVHSWLSAPPRRVVCTSSAPRLRLSCASSSFGDHRSVVARHLPPHARSSLRSRRPPPKMTSRAG